MKKFILMASTILMSAPVFAKSQAISCIGLYQEGTLSIENNLVGVRMNDEGVIYSATLSEKTINQDGTLTYSTPSAPIKVTFPKIWLNKTIPRFSKHDPRRGYQIKEQVRFVFDHAYGMDQSLSLSECESWLDR